MALHKFSEAKQFLENAVEIFKHEDPSSPDGQLWQKANTLMEVVSHAHPVWFKPSAVKNQPVLLNLIDLDF